MSRVVAAADYHSPLFNQLSCYRGEVLVVDWAKSTQGWLWCKRDVPPDALEAQEGLVPATVLRESWEERSAQLGLSIISSEMENDVLKYCDPVLRGSAARDGGTAGAVGGQGVASLFGNSASVAEAASTSSLFSGSFSLSAAMESNANQAPILAPGLANFIWPLHPAEFMTRIWQKKAYVVQGCGERLPKMKEDLMNYNVEQLVATLQDCVVWMKTTEGKIQHFYADNRTAYHCYLAGHSLYFNPPVELQKTYIKQLAEDLGANFGIKKDDGFGGDIEIFAVRGKNVTDWHFDAQENFTIQLTGCKRWSIQPGVSCPITNHTNPKNIATQKYEDHRKVHRAYAPAADVEPPKDFSKAQIFVLRPGSVMYVPGGYWHHVTCDSDEGSLSLNFSISTMTWMELLLNSLTQHLWKYSHWRENILVKDPSSARAHLQSLLDRLPQEITQLTARDLLPKGLFRENKEKEINVETNEQGTHYEVTKETVLRRNPVAVIVKDLPVTSHKPCTSCSSQVPREAGKGRKRPLHSLLNGKDETYEDDEDDREGKDSWTLHVSFGNNKEIFRSNLEVKLFVKREMACVIDWIEKRGGSRSTSSAEPGGRWASFTAGQLYAESGFREWVKSRKEERRKRRKTAEMTHTPVDQNKKSTSHETLMQMRRMLQDDNDYAEVEVDEGDDQDDDGLGWDDQEEPIGGFGDIEQLLSVLIFNGYLTKVKPQQGSNVKAHGPPPSSGL